MDTLYHDSVGDTINKYGNDFVGFVNRDTGDGADIHINFLENITNSLVGYVNELGDYDSNKQSSGAQSSKSLKNITKNLNEKKITLLELDVWSLLSKLGSSKLLKDIDNEQCHSMLKSAVANMGDDDSFETCIYSIYAADERVLKMKLLQEWLEVAARYRNNSSINVIDFNNSETIASYEQSLMKSNINNINNIADKEVLVKLIWQYLRCGLYLEAQRLSTMYETYCLGTSLGFLMPLGAPSGSGPTNLMDNSMSYWGGNNDSFVDAPESDDYKRSTEVSKVSAVRQPVKMYSCFKYINHLSSSSASFSSTDSEGRGEGATDVAIEYEKVIIALLSNNLSFLFSSPFLSEWSDKLYIVVKALHETSLMKSLHKHKLQKILNSRLYSDCKEEVLRAEEGLLASVGLTDDIDRTADMKAILKSKKLLLSDSTHRNTNDFYRIEPFFTDMQIHIIEGYSSIQLFVDTQITDFYTSNYKLYQQQCTVEEFASMARTLCHFLVWCRYAEYDVENVPINDASSTRGDPALMNHVFPDELLYASLQMHIGQLINSGKFNVVPVYAVYLSKSRRVALYVQLFESFLLQASNVSSNVSSASHATFIEHNSLLDLSRALVRSNEYFLIDFSDVISMVINNQIDRKKSQVASSTNARSGNGSEFIDLDDLRLVQLLYIVFSYDRYLEGVKIANSLMTLFFLDNSSNALHLTGGYGSYNIASVRLVLSTIPQNAILCGNNSINNYLVKSYDSSYAAAENELVMSVWNTNLHVLAFFESYRGVVGLYAEWEGYINTLNNSDSSSKYLMTSADYLSISERASHVISALLSLLNPILLQFPKPVSDDVKATDVFSMLSALTYRQMNLMIDKLLLIDRYEEEEGEVSKDNSEQNLSLYASLQSMYSKAVGANVLFDRLNRFNLSNLSHSGALTSSERSKLNNGITTTTLHTLKSDLRDCSDYNIVLKNIVYDVLVRHNFICFQTAALLLKNTSSNNLMQSSVLFWYHRVVNVVTFISKESGDDSSNLYNILDAAMIDRLLRDVLSANIQILNLQADR